MARSRLALEFTECDVCAGKPGAAQLCSGCVHNRAAIVALGEQIGLLTQERDELKKPIPMRLTCPMCNTLHIDKGEFAATPHSTHVCQNCGLPWKPALVPTVGVQFLPGHKNG